MTTLRDHALLVTLDLRSVRVVAIDRSGETISESEATRDHRDRWTTANHGGHFLRQWTVLVYLLRRAWAAAARNMAEQRRLARMAGTAPDPTYRQDRCGVCRGTGLRMRGGHYQDCGACDGVGTIRRREAA